MKAILIVIAGILMWAVPRPLAEADYQVYPCEFVAPIYPPLARLSRTQGDVSIQANIDSSGRPVGIEVLHDTAHSSNAEILERAAVTAIRMWRFCPTSSDQLNQKTIVILFQFKLVVDPKPRNTDEWFPTNVSFHSPGTVEISTTTSTVLND